MEGLSTHSELITLTTSIVSSFVINNVTASADLPALISSVFSSLSATANPGVPRSAEAPTPAVPIKKSIGTDFIVCLEDGKKMKMLKRHLATRYNLAPDDYRRRWGLPGDYPMVAPAYALRRSELAKSFGLGRGRTSPPASEAAPEPSAAVTAPAAPARSRPVRIGGRRKAA